MVSLLDGTTLRMRSVGDIPKHFPPHGNQAKTPAYWCLMRVVVNFCAFRATAMDCCLAPSTSSQQELASKIILNQSLAPHLFIADRNFGIFRIVQTALRTGSHALVRMTKPRARKLLNRTLSLGDHVVQWTHSRHDKLQPDLSTDPIPGRLLVVKLQRNGFRTQDIFLLYNSHANRPLPGSGISPTLRCALAHRIEFALSQNPNAHGTARM